MFSHRLLLPGAALTACWCAPSFAPAQGAPDGPPGLIADYYRGDNFEEGPFSRVDLQVDNTWGAGGPATVGENHFSVRWMGWLLPTYTEPFTLYTVSDDGVRLYVDGALALDNWTLHGVTQDEAFFELRLGEPVPVVLEYYESAGSATMQLGWRSPSQADEIVPSTQLIAAAPWPPDMQPVVQIVVSDSRAIEGSDDTGRMTVYRWGDLSTEIRIPVTYDGEAEPGVVIEGLPEEIVLPANRMSHSLEIVPFDDDMYQGRRQLHAIIGPGEGYALGQSVEASVTLIDDERAPVEVGHTITGHVSYVGGRPGRFVIEAAAVDGERSQAILVSPGIYALSNLPAGDYLIRAFLDEDLNGERDPDEIEGLAGGAAEVSVTLPPDAVDIDWLINAPVIEPPDGGITDGGITDGGVVDAGAADGGGADADLIDAETDPQRDAALSGVDIDAGGVADGGASNSGSDGEPSGPAAGDGGGCQGQRGPGALWLWLGTLIAIRRRRLQR